MPDPNRRWTIQVVEWPSHVSAGVERGGDVQVVTADDLPGLHDQLADYFTEESPDA